eukprot:403333169
MDEQVRLDRANIESYLISESSPQSDSSSVDLDGLIQKQNTQNVKSKGYTRLGLQKNILQKSSTQNKNNSGNLAQHLLEPKSRNLFPVDNSGGYSHFKIQGSSSGNYQKKELKYSSNSSSIGMGKQKSNSRKAPSYGSLIEASSYQSHDLDEDDQSASVPSSHSLIEESENESTESYTLGKSHSKKQSAKNQTNSQENDDIMKLLRQKNDQIRMEHSNQNCINLKDVIKQVGSFNHDQLAFQQQQKQQLNNAVELKIGLNSSSDANYNLNLDEENKYEEEFSGSDSSMSMEDSDQEEENHFNYMSFKKVPDDTLQNIRNESKPAKIKQTEEDNVDFIIEDYIKQQNNTQNQLNLNKQLQTAQIFNEDITTQQHYKNPLNKDEKNQIQRLNAKIQLNSQSLKQYESGDVTAPQNPSSQMLKFMNMLNKPKSQEDHQFTSSKLSSQNQKHPKIIIDQTDDMYRSQFCGGHEQHSQQTKPSTSFQLANKLTGYHQQLMHQYQSNMTSNGYNRRVEECSEVSSGEQIENESVSTNSKQANIYSPQKQSQKSLLPSPDPRSKRIPYLSSQDNIKSNESHDVNITPSSLFFNDQSASHDLQINSEQQNHIKRQQPKSIDVEDVEEIKQNSEVIQTQQLQPKQDDILPNQQTMSYSLLIRSQGASNNPLSNSQQ